MQLNDTLSVQPDGWTLVESGWDADRAIAVGSNFLSGNGYLGYRGTTPEQGSDGYVALVVSDTYDCADGKWRELTTAPNPLYVAAGAKDSTVAAEFADSVETRLDLRTGVFTASFTQQVGGVSVTVRTDRFASYDDIHLLAQRWSITADGDVEMTIDTGIDTDIWSLNGVHLPRVDVRIDDVGHLLATGTTGESGITIAVASTSHILHGPAQSAAKPTRDGVHGTRHAATLHAGEPVVIDTIASIYSSNDVDDPGTSASRSSAEAKEQGFDALLAASSSRWDEIWSAIDVVIEGDPLAQAALRFSTYHNRICIPAHSDHLPVGARGLSCQAYQGSAFWDEEVYNLPAFLFTEPDLARSLLIYRHRTLDGARRKAARLGYEGAYYAWVSGTTGDELCPDIFFVDVLTGRPIRNHFNVWQMHISPDVATTIERYVQVTSDEDYLVDFGTEIVFEVARFLRSFVRYNDAAGTFHCMRLLGPDEWHENVDDNAFTNYQSHAALDFAIRTHERFTREHPEELADLVRRMNLQVEEVEAWRRVRDALVLPAPDPATGVVEQFKGFHALEDVTPDEVRKRLLDPGEYWGWPNGVAVATQVSKQADVPMLMWLQRNRFPLSVQEANYHHYLQRCAHGSSLSHAAFGMVASQIGAVDEAYEHFLSTATVDLLNTAHAVVGGTFIGGIHTAACGGTYQLAVLGFGGLDAVDDHLVVAPQLPAQWVSLTYPVNWRGQQFRVHATHDAVTISSNSANERVVPVLLRSELVELPAGETVAR